MLSQTKEQTQQLINKVQVLDFVLQSLQMAHKEDAAQVDTLFREASAHKMKLVAEILRLSGASEIINVVPID